jgi:predicted esterase
MPSVFVLAAPSAEHRSTVIILAHEESEKMTQDLKQYISATGSTATRWVLICPTESPWFELPPKRGPDRGPGWQLTGFENSVWFITLIINQEASGWNGDARRIFLLGTGQAMAVGFEALLNSPLKLGGFIGANGWMLEQQHREEEVPAESTPMVNKTPVFLIYDESNQDITKLGERARQTLEFRRFENVTWEGRNNNREWLFHCVDFMRDTSKIEVV